MTKDKRCAKPFAAEISTAFQNEKLAVQTEETIILQILARGSKYKSKTLARYRSHGKTENKTHPSSSNVQLNEPLESVSGQIDVNGGIFKICTGKKACNSTGIQRLLRSGRVYHNCRICSNCGSFAGT